MSGTKRVLAALGSKLMNRVLSSTLQEVGYEVRSAFNAHEALLLVSAFKPHAVILDAMIPEGDGYRISRTIKTRHGQGRTFVPPKVILLSNAWVEHDHDIERMFRDFSKADVMVDTPFDPNLLLQKLEDLIGSPTDSSATGLSPRKPEATE